MPRSSFIYLFIILERGGDFIILFFKDRSLPRVWNSDQPFTVTLCREFSSSLVAPPWVNATHFEFPGTPRLGFLIASTPLYLYYVHWERFLRRRRSGQLHSSSHTRTGTSLVWYMYVWCKFLKASQGTGDAVVMWRIFPPASVSVTGTLSLVLVK